MDEQGADSRNPEFERQLERLFAQAPALPDPDAFAGRVQARLASNWRMRTAGIAVAGVVGGVIAASQIIGSGLAVQVQHASTQSVRAADVVYHQASSGFELLSQVTPSAGLFWVVSGLMILAAVIGATRVLDEA
jgi:hypothetical protein